MVVNDRWGSGIKCKHGDFYTCADRYNPGRLIRVYTGSTGVAPPSVQIIIRRTYQGVRGGQGG